MLGLRYGSEEAAAQAPAWMAAVERAAYRASAALAAEKGPFPLYDRDAYLARRNRIAALDADDPRAIAEHGIRNALVTSIAPTGTISLYAGNVSSGVEPIFAPSYTARSRSATERARRGSRRLRRGALARARRERAALPPAFVDAQSLAPEDHVRMQAAVQAHVDSSISKTINVPEDIDFEAFKDVYLNWPTTPAARAARPIGRTT